MHNRSLILKIRPYIVALMIFLFSFELGARVFWSWKFNVSAWDSRELLYAYYPKLKKVSRTYSRSEDSEHFDVLLLGGSVLNWAARSIEEGLSEVIPKPVRIHNLSSLGHSSLDSLYQYQFLQEYSFDLVVFYHGINELRTNNIPTDYFQADYSHYHWYSYVNLINSKIAELPVYLPVTLKYFALVVKEKIGASRVLPRDWPPSELLEYGLEIKSRSSFENNLGKIIEIAQMKNERLLLMTMATYIPADYSLELFASDSLDYSIEGDERYPIELWGSKNAISIGMRLHNESIRNLARENSVDDFIDQAEMIPKAGSFFTDVCHFSSAGMKLFVDHIADQTIRKRE